MQPHRTPFPHSHAVIWGSFGCPDLRPRVFWQPLFSGFARADPVHWRVQICVTDKPSCSGTTGIGFCRQPFGFPGSLVGRLVVRSGIWGNRSGLGGSHRNCDSGDHHGIRPKMGTEKRERLIEPQHNGQTDLEHRKNRTHFGCGLIVLTIVLLLIQHTFGKRPAGSEGWDGGPYLCKTH